MVWLECRVRFHATDKGCARELSGSRTGEIDGTPGNNCNHVGAVPPSNCPSINTGLLSRDTTTIGFMHTHDLLQLPSLSPLFLLLPSIAIAASSPLHRSCLPSSTPPAQYCPLTSSSLRPSSRTLLLSPATLALLPSPSMANNVSRSKAWCWALGPTPYGDSSSLTSCVPRIL